MTELLDIMLDQLPAAVWTTDQQLRVLSIAGKAFIELGVTPEPFVGVDITQFVGHHEGPNAATVLAAHKAALNGEPVSFPFVWPSGVALKAHVRPLRSDAGTIIGVIGVALDITTQVETERRLEHQAHHDPLTDLPNRAMLERVLQHRLAELNSPGEELAVIFLDLEGFADLNDMFGHSRGDQILIDVAERLRSRLSPDDFLCRWGGDEFVILHRTTQGRSEIGKVVEFMLEALGPGFLIEGRIYHIEANAGVSIAPHDGLNQESLLRAADAAMYRAKKQGRGTYLFFDTDLHASIRRRLRIENLLRSSLPRNELSVVYQPIWDATGHQILRVEALLRWASPEFGQMAPDVFIPIAEETNLIRPIGFWVLREACRQAKLWQAEGCAPVRICVNVSPNQLHFKHFAYRVRSILEETSLDPRLLDLELTERVMLDAEPRCAAMLKELRDLGVRFSIDDFGTGYSSLRYLKTMQIDTIKIDRYFVKDIPRDSFSVAVADSIIKLAHSLHLKVIAEGIETEDQREMLHSMGCDELQGFLLGAPLPGEECGRILLGPHETSAS